MAATMVRICICICNGRTTPNIAPANRETKKGCPAADGALCHDSYRVPVRRSRRGSAWNAYRDAVKQKQGNIFPAGGMYCQPEADKRAQFVNGVSTTTREEGSRVHRVT